MIQSIVNEIEKTNFELSDMMAACILFGGQEQVTSESFGYCNIHDHIKFIMRKKDFDLLPDEHDTPENKEKKLRCIKYSGETCHQGMFPKIVCNNVTGKKIQEHFAVPRPLNYELRGPKLVNMNRVEYTE